MIKLALCTTITAVSSIALTASNVPGGSTFVNTMLEMPSNGSCPISALVGGRAPTSAVIEGGLR